MARRTGGYRRSAVWRPCGVTPHAALQNKSVVCSGSWVTISTVMKLRWSVKRGGINAETYTKSTCSHRISSLLRLTCSLHAVCCDWYAVCWDWLAVYMQSAVIDMQFAEIDMQFTLHAIAWDWHAVYMQFAETDMQFTCSWLRSETDMQFTLHAVGWDWHAV